jgi:hypothetical protein
MIDKKKIKLKKVSNLTLSNKNSRRKVPSNRQLSTINYRYIAPKSEG